MSPNLIGGRHIYFGADPVGVGIGLGWMSHFLVCTISCEPVFGFLPNFQGYINRT